MNNDIVESIEIKEDEKVQLQLKECHLVSYDVEPTEYELSILGVKEYARILHDNDFLDDGTLKKAHYHVYLKFYKKKDINVIAKIFNIKPNLVQKVKNKGALIRYFIHKDNPEKYQYSDFEILSNFDIYEFLEYSVSDCQFVLNVINKIRDNEIKTFTDLVYYSLSSNKADYVSKRAYFFKCLINDK